MAQSVALPKRQILSMKHTGSCGLWAAFRWLLPLMLLGILSGCEQWRELRRLFHPEEGPGNAALRVEVTPTEGIIIRLNGHVVAQNSPYEAKGLNAGVHHLQVEANGYFAVSLPLELKAGRMVVLPVALRRNPDHKGRQKKSIDSLPEPPQPPAQTLPAGVDEISLLLVAKPPVALLHDGLPMSGGRLRLQRVHGQVQAGVLVLHYEIGARGLLRLKIPAEEAKDGVRFTKDGKPLATGKWFHLHKGSMNLRRLGADNTDQSLLLRRRP